MVKVLKGLPVSLIVVLVSACHVEVSCGNADKNETEKTITEAKLSGVASVVASTHPTVTTDMRCKMAIEKTATNEKATATINCFAESSDNSAVTYRGSSTTFAYEPRGESETDDRMLYLDESANVRAKIEYDRTKNPAGTLVVWSVDPAWEIKAEAPERESK